MNKVINNAPLQGTIEAISSKSYAQRAVLASLLCKESIEIHMHHISKDIEVSLQIVRDLGGSVVIEGDCYIITPPESYPRKATISVGESGTSLRFIIPIIAALGIEAIIERKGSLISRTNAIYADLLPKHGVSYREEGANIHISGQLVPGRYIVPGNTSSQFISGLLFALAYFTELSTVTVIDSFESKDYVAMSCAVLKDFSVFVEFDEKRAEYHIAGPYQSPKKYIVEGDWSNALFWLAGGLCVKGLNDKSLQADKRALDVFLALGYDNISTEGIHMVQKRSSVENLDIDARQMPDAIPILAMVAARKEHVTTTIHHIERLRLKESDRVHSVITVLRMLGVMVEEGIDSFTFKGRHKFNGGSCDSFNDHRIVMMLAIAATYATEPIEIRNADAVAKSYPLFFNDLERRKEYV